MAGRLTRRRHGNSLGDPEHGRVGEEAVRMSEQTPQSADEAPEAGTTDEAFGNLSVEDDASGTTDPADLAGSAGDEDSAPDEVERSSEDGRPTT